MARCSVDVALARCSNRRAHDAAPRCCLLVVLAPDGRVLATYSDPVDFCAALQRQLEKVEDPRALKALWARHAAALEMLRWNVPDRTNEEGIHWAEVLLACYSRRREVVNELAGTQQASASASQPLGDSSGNSVPTRPEPRRARDKEHLRFVASLPCLVCGRAPGQPHHVRFAQPRAIRTGRGSYGQWDAVRNACMTTRLSTRPAGGDGRQDGSPARR